MEFYYQGMSAGAEKIAGYVTANAGKAAAMTSRELGTAAGTGAATVIRYAKSLGFSGYDEFREFLADAVHAEGSDDLDVSRLEKTSQLKHRIISFDYNFLQTTVNGIDEMSLDEACRAIRKASHVQLVAMGSAAGVALAASSLFNTFGIPAEYHPDELQQCRAAARLNKDDVIIGINYAGSFRGLADSFSAAKENGAGVLLITGTKAGVLSRYADITFLTPVRNSSNRLNIPTSAMCQIAVIQMILSRMWQMWPEELSAASERIGALVKKN